MPSANVPVAVCGFLETFIFFLGSFRVELRFVLSSFLEFRQVAGTLCVPLGYPSRHGSHSLPSPSLPVGIRLEKLY